MSVFRQDEDVEVDRDGRVVARRQVRREVTESVNDLILRAELKTSLDILRSIVNSSGVLTTAQLSSGLKTVARALLVIGRLYLRNLDSTG